MNAAVLTISDGVVAGEREDASGDVLEPCRRVALSGEFLEGRSDDLLRARAS